VTNLLENVSLLLMTI